MANPTEAFTKLTVAFDTRIRLQLSCSERASTKWGLFFMPEQSGVAVSLAVVSPAPILDCQDRCDRCGAQAYVWTILTFPSSETGELLFCRHHWLKHRDVIRPFVSVIVDESRQLFKHIEDDRGVR